MVNRKKFFKFYGRVWEDFELWSAKTEALLEAQGVLDFVTVDVMGTISENEPHTDAALKVAKARVTFFGLDYQPLRILMIKRRKLFQIWKLLRDRYAVGNVSAQVHILVQPE